jgi:hypothetical protein
MFKMDNLSSLQGTSRNLLILCLFVFCVLGILSSLNFSLTSGWDNFLTSEHHHLIESEEDTIWFAFLVISIIGVSLGHSKYPWKPVYFPSPSNQLPPPKSI